MPEMVEKVECTLIDDSVLILQGESNYAPWLHSLINHLGPEYWRVLLGVERSPSQHDKFVHSVNPAQAVRDEKTRLLPILSPEMDARKSPNPRLDQFDDVECDKRSQTLSYLQGTLNEEARYLIRDIDSPSEAFNKLRIFYGKPRHQTLALRRSKWANLRYVPGGSYAIAVDFIRNFGERVRDIEEISGGTLNHRTILHSSCMLYLTTVNIPASS